MLALRVWLVLLGIAVICGIAGYWIAPKSNDGFADKESVLAFAALVAVGIERILEFVWSVLASPLGSWWPLKQLNEAINAVETQTNEILGPVLVHARAALEKARKGLSDTDDRAKAIDEQLKKINAAEADFAARVINARKLAKGSERMTLLHSVTLDAAATLTAATHLAADARKDVHDAATKAVQTVDLAMTIADSFTDNPARRIASILLGAGLGMIAAGFLGLNIFVAVLGYKGTGQAGDPLAAGLGVVLTGIVLGLGSNPTHEVVKALQSYKDSRTGTVDTAVVEGRAQRMERRVGVANLGAITEVGLMPFDSGAGEAAPVREYRLRRTQ